MAQTTKTRRIIGMTGLLAGLAMAGIPAFAQTNNHALTADQGPGMMSHGMPDGDAMTPRMMMDPEMRQQMSRMMDNCNRMMESMMPNKGDAPTPSTPPNKG